MSLYKAFLFDLNGTMVNDMDYHIDAWHKLLCDFGAAITREETKMQCYGKNHELLERIFPSRFTEEEKIALSVAKEKKYQEDFRPQLKLIDGLDLFLEKAHRERIQMAIGSAALMMNVDFVLDGLHIRHYFDAIVSAEQVAKSKPDPETFMQCAERLGVDPAQCLVFEDSPKGTESALRAGMDCVVITTLHRPDEFNPQNVRWIIDDYSGDVFEQITQRSNQA